MGGMAVEMRRGAPLPVAGCELEGVQLFPIAPAFLCSPSIKAAGAHLLSRRQVAVIASLYEVTQLVLGGRLEREIVNHPHALGG